MLRFLVLFCLFWGWNGPLAACGPEELCRFGENAEYRVLPPHGWDGKKVIGAFVFVHGHRSSAAEMIRYRDLADAVHELGFMLVAPQGAGDSWSTPGSPGEGRRDELAYISGLLDDLFKRFPIDRNRIVGSGFSQGASVIWEVACHGDGRFSAFLPVAGVWWQPMPLMCKAPPRPMLHIHGTRDGVMPMTGRQLRNQWKQGVVMEAFATMQSIHVCHAGSAREKILGPLKCSFNETCGSDQKLALCLHDGDHHINPAWFRDIRGWLDEALK